MVWREKMDKNEALKIWKYEMDDREYGYDFAGRKIKKSDYGLTNSVGWTIGYLFPIELGGKKDDKNIKIMHYTTLEEKGLNYPQFSILHKGFVVKYDDKEDYYYIEKISSDDFDEEGFF